MGKFGGAKLFNETPLITGRGGTRVRTSFKKFLLEEFYSIILMGNNVKICCSIDSIV